METTVIHIKQAPPGWKADPRYRYIGRGSVHGNPYRIGDKHPVTGQPMTRNDVCDLFEERALPAIKAAGNLACLKGKTLVCFCHPLRCHGHTLAREADNQE